MGTAARNHSRRRLVERFGVKLTRNVRGFLLARIRRGDAELLGVDEKRFTHRSRWRVCLDNVTKEGCTPRYCQVVLEGDEIVTVMRCGKVVG